MFEEEDGAAVPPAPQPGDHPAPVIEEPVNVQIPDENDHHARRALQPVVLDARRQARVMRARRGFGPLQRQGLRQRDPEEMEVNEPLYHRPLDRLPFPLEPTIQLPQVPRDYPPPYETPDQTRKGKGRAEEADDIEEGSPDFPSQRRIRRRIHTEEDETMSRDSPDSQVVQPSTSLNGSEASTFPFTFRASSSFGSSSPEPFMGSDPFVTPPTSKGKYAWNPDFQIDSQPTSSSVSPSTTPSLHVNIGTPLRRPPMANSTVYAEGATPNKLQPNPFLPLSSPSLAMYLAPEELEAGPSGYFDSNERSKEELEEEFEHFFRRPDRPETPDPEIPPPSDIQDQVAFANPQNAPINEYDEEEDDDDDDDDEEEGDVPAPVPAAEAGRMREDDDDDDENDEGDGEVANLGNENAPAVQIQPALDQPGDMDELEPGVEDDLDGAMEGWSKYFSVT